jgi:hypothetical protein
MRSSLVLHSAITNNLLLVGSLIAGYDTHDPQWWKNIEDEDPITLEPIKSLSVPPFLLHKLPFDSKALCAYIVARSKFENPLTRSPLTFKDCRALDFHIAKYHGNGGRETIKVAEAFRLHESVKVKGREGTEVVDAAMRRHEEIRGVAAVALQSLFSYNVWGGRGVQGGQQEGLVVIDDQMVVAEAADRWADNVAGRDAPPEPGDITQSGDERSER